VPASASTSSGIGRSRRSALEIERLSETGPGRVRPVFTPVVGMAGAEVFAASVAHEVNQPLCGVIINANLCLRILAAENPEVSSVREAVSRILRDAERASEVVMRLRTLFGRSKTSTELVDLNETANEVIALSLSELQRNGVSLRAELEPNLPFIAGDRVQLEQVIANLLSNASDAMASVEDGAKQVVVKTEREGDGLVRLSVKDAGVGLDFQNLERLFQPFYTTKNAGMGIGLFVSWCVIERHDGCLNVSDNDGPGVTFSFSVPSVHQEVSILPHRSRSTIR
jgi:signal transduction histidine kinase